MTTNPELPLYLWTTVKCHCDFYVTEYMVVAAHDIDSANTITWHAACEDCRGAEGGNMVYADEPAAIPTSPGVVIASV